MRVGWCAVVVLVFFSLCHGQGDFLEIGSLAPKHHYDCGVYGMQLLVFPSQGRHIHFKVVDEFETAFEITNCSICRHWITSNEARTAVIFSTGYNGCHVLKKDGSNQLKVRIEEVMSNGGIANTHNINMICPKPQEEFLAPEDNMRHMPQPQPGLVYPVPQPQPQPSLVRPVYESPLQPQLVLVQPVPQPQPSLVHPASQSPPQPQLSLVHPAPQPQPQPSLVHPASESPPQPGIVHPAPQPWPQPTLVYPDYQPWPQPSLVHLVPQLQPQPSLVHPASESPQPGLVHLVPQPQPQPQPSLLHTASESPLLPQPGLFHPAPQPQPQPQPSMLHPASESPQPGLVHLVPQPQPQPSLLHPASESPLLPQPGLVHPAPQPQPQPQPSLVHMVPQPQPNLVHPASESPPQPRPGIVHPVPQPRPQPTLMHLDYQPWPQPSLVHLVPQPQPQPSLVHPASESPLLPQPGLVHPAPQPQPQPSLVHMVPQPQPNLVHPASESPPQPQPGIVHPVPQPRPQPTLMHPDYQPWPQPSLVHLVPQPQPQPSLVHPASESPLLPHPGLLQPAPQTHPLPQPSLVHMVPQPQPQPSLVHLVPQPQPQPSIVYPASESLPLPQPDLVHPAPQPQPQPQPQPSLVHPASESPPLPQPGPVHPAPRPRPQPQPQPSLVHPASESPQVPQPGLVHPVPWPLPRPQPGLEHPAPQPRPGILRPAPQPQPSLVHPVPQLYPSQYNRGSPLTLQQCQVSSGKIPCATTEGPTACYVAGCCYDDADPTIPCYYGNTVTVQCLRDGHFILVVSRDMADYPVILDSVRLSYAQTGCDPVRKTESFLVFHFPLTQCGTTTKLAGGRLMYENQLVSGIDILNGPEGLITRDSTFILHARCIYNVTDFLPVEAEVFLPPTPAPVTQIGPLRLELRIARDSSYTSYYSDDEYPLVKVLRDPVHVEIRILHRMDASLILVLHDCWATPSTNPLEQLQWPILLDGCPFEGDNYKTQLVSMGPATADLPFPTHYHRFIISTFAFMDSASQILLDGLVYLFCSVSVCYPSQLERCKTTCQIPPASRGRRFLEISNGTEPLDLVSSHGAVIFKERSWPHEKKVHGEADEEKVNEETDLTSIGNLILMLFMVVALLLMGMSLVAAVLVFCKKRSRRTIS